MDDFATPGQKNGFGLEPSPANYIEPNKRPLSSMCPVIVVDKNGNAVFIAGSAGGSKITTTVAYVIISWNIKIITCLADCMHFIGVHEAFLVERIIARCGVCEKDSSSVVANGNFPWKWFWRRNSRRFTKNGTHCHRRYVGVWIYCSYGHFKGKRIRRSRLWSTAIWQYWNILSVFKFKRNLKANIW